MPTTRPTPTFETIDRAALLDVQGGCGKKRCTCAPQAVAAPAPAAAAPLPSSDISTSVNISYQ